MNLIPVMETSTRCRLTGEKKGLPGGALGHPPGLQLGAESGDGEEVREEVAVRLLAGNKHFTN